MGKHFLLLLYVVLLALVKSHALVSPEDYWKLMLPNTLMPQSIKDSLPHDLTGGENDAKLGRKGFLPSTTGSLKTLNGYIGLLSYNKESLTTLNGYIGLLSYHKKESTSSQQYLSYSDTEKKPDQYLSYGSNDDKKEPDQYLSYSSNDKKEPDQYLSYSDNKMKSSKSEDSSIAKPVFFLEKDLKVGTKMKLKFDKGTRKASFLPREVANTIPFSSDKIGEITRILSLNPNSEKAYILSKRIELCEEPTVEGVEKQCVTSLESMVDYVVSMLGKNHVKAMSTKVEKEGEMEYRIARVNKLSNHDHETVVCHKMDYPYAVFFCHRTKTIRSYIVSLVGKDGTKMEGVVACHKETNAFLENYEVNVLKVEPGSAHICHFPSAEDTIIWVRN